MKVLNIGSLNIDRTYEVARFVKSGETIKVLSFHEQAGGKGLNQSIALARAGTPVWHAGALGPDGDGLLEALSNAGVHCQYISRVSCPTGHAVIQVDNEGQNNILVFPGANQRLSPLNTVKALDALETDDIVLLQNETALCAYIINEAHRRGLKVAFNPSPMSIDIKKLDLSLVDLFILNELEASDLLGKPLTSDPRVLAQRLCFQLSRASVVLTCGSKGSIFAHGDELLMQPAFHVNAVDTTGAGDTFCGYFIAGMVKKLTIEQSLMRANAAAAISVTKRGAAQSIPEYGRVDEFIADKVYSTKQGLSYRNASQVEII